MAKHKMPERDISSVEMSTTIVGEEITETYEETTTTVVEESAPVIGVITGCVRLNVRKNPRPDAEVVSELVASSEVMIDEDKSTIDFYKVCTASGVEGFCMKKFITIQK